MPECGSEIVPGLMKLFRHGGLPRITSSTAHDAAMTASVSRPRSKRSVGTGEHLAIGRQQLPSGSGPDSHSPAWRVQTQRPLVSPAVVSRHNANVVYHGGNVLFRTTDRGKTWAPISPDLTRNDKATQGFGGTPITNEGAGGEVYGAIVSIAESPHDGNTIYVGTDDGLVQLTRDGGKTWTNVTPSGVGVGLTNNIDVSPFDAGTVYVAYRMDRRGDYAPYPFKSTDYGKTWTRIGNGLRDGEPVRVIREDPVRQGLLYAGTETGVYVSFDAGRNWQAFSRNLPNTPVSDLEVRHGDLYAATEGRAFWALDDLTPLRQMTDQVAKADVHLFAPRAALLGGGSSAPTTTAGRNPPAGANVLFLLAKAPDSSTVVTLEFLDAAGRLLRSFTKAPAAPAPPTPGAPRTMPVPKQGLNAFQWDLRAEPPATLPGNINIWGGPGGGYLVAPGRYQARLTVGTVVQTQAFGVQQDPRMKTPANEIAARDSLTRAINARVGEINESLLRIRDVKEQVSKFVGQGGIVLHVRPAVPIDGRTIGVLQLAQFIQLFL